MLFYMRSLLPGYPDNPLFEAIFIDLLPANARDAAVKHKTLEDMADAADKVLAEAPATSIVTSVACSLDADVAVARLAKPPHWKSSRDFSLCFIHRNYGRNAFKCASPKSCSMKDVIARPDSSRVQGNANAGRQ